MVTPTLETPPGAELGVMCWRFEQPVAALSSAAVGGGFVTTSWILNIRVPLRYDRVDLDVHGYEVAASLGLAGEGVVLFTAADIRRRAHGTHGSVRVDATSGVTKPTWAADPDGGWTPWTPGTINIVAQLPVAFTHAAAVNAVITMTEAKTQALGELGIPGTGTASDAVVLTWPVQDEPVEQFGGPRSRIGASIAMATHEAIIQSAGVNQR